MSLYRHQNSEPDDRGRQWRTRAREKGKRSERRRRSGGQEVTGAKSKGWCGSGKHGTRSMLCALGEAPFFSTTTTNIFSSTSLAISCFAPYFLAWSQSCANGRSDRNGWCGRSLPSCSAACHCAPSGCASPAPCHTDRNRPTFCFDRVVRLLE